MGRPNKSHNSLSPALEIHSPLLLGSGLTPLPLNFDVILGTTLPSESIRHAFFEGGPCLCASQAMPVNSECRVHFPFCVSDKSLDHHANRLVLPETSWSLRLIGEKEGKREKVQSERGPIGICNHFLAVATLGLKFSTMKQSLGKGLTAVLGASASAER